MQHGVRDASGRVHFHRATVKKITMKKKSFFVFLSFVGVAALGGGHGIVKAEYQSQTVDAHQYELQMPERSADGFGHENHEHGMIEVPANQPMPTVELVVHPDSRQGWNLEIQVTNFRFAPETLNQTSLPTEGHAHLYVNGEKITRIYGGWYYLESLPAGRHEVTVSLNTNTHEVLAHHGEPIESTVVIEVP